MSNAVNTLRNVPVSLTCNLQDVRADRVQLLDVLVLERLPELGGGEELMVVRSLELVGDDVVVNGTLTTSQGNRLTVVR